MTRKRTANNVQNGVNEVTENNVEAGVNNMTENNVENGVNEVNGNPEYTINEVTENLEDTVDEMNQEPDVSSEFEIDPALMGEEFNCVRPKRFPYGIVINAEIAGLFIPEKSLAKAGWFGTPEIVEKDLSGGVERGLFMTNARMIILGNVRPYLRYKTDLKDNPELEGIMIGWYDEYAEEIDKKLMSAVSEHLIMFLDNANNFLHQTPIRIRFKNVALWSLREALEQYYSQAELTFARMLNKKPSGKDDRWRSLCVVDVEFKGVKEGDARQKSYCCKVGTYIHPDEENFPALFMGTRTKMSAVLEKYDTSLGFDESVKALLPAPTKLALPDSQQ
ncbi:hypothetical protein BMF77_pc00021 (plasmid) [Dolichospermum sp. UHCC 0315A]|uniref:DUF5895 domain-containing protein n=1 Tax=Dolichospermum sp. UHCC 0315A TaxID=1914871 RepID=UPI001251F8E7|nr:DUF5895 domain-containing protein [Dolichospermum sp. UHCC 0315A]MDM3860397.1 DUF5895 domain-containing protein [Aphanizomenon gracile PMC644.10]QEI44181.1 hypothetical protein BMF77_04812 [Dolichospermum sp. UHCC 0315A]QEI44452.1 hypothetical protein BMF77_pc00021 [Dolichospermum sp. UHCC 0315A]